MKKKTTSYLIPDPHLLFVLVIIFLILAGYFAHNSIYIETSRVQSWELKHVPSEIESPVKVKATINYRNHYTKTSTHYVDVCDVKNTKKEMRKEMRTIRKKFRNDCR